MRRQNRAWLIAAARIRTADGSSPTSRSMFPNRKAAGSRPRVSVGSTTKAGLEELVLPGFVLPGFVPLEFELLSNSEFARRIVLLNTRARDKTWRSPQEGSAYR